MEMKKVRLSDCRKQYTYDQDKACTPQETIDKFMKRLKEANLDILKEVKRIDTGIPTVGALCWDPSTFPEKSEIVYTAGTTPGPDKALIRALTEVAQLAGDFHTEANCVASGLPKFLSLEEADYVVHPYRTINLDEMDDVSDADFYQEVIHNPVSAIDYANLANNLQHIGQDDEAMHNYRVALSMDPEIEFARKGLTELLEQHTE